MPKSQGQNLALTDLCVPSLLDSGNIQKTRKKKKKNKDKKKKKKKKGRGAGWLACPFCMSIDFVLTPETLLATRLSSKASFPQSSGAYVTKFAPDEAVQLIAGGKMMFAESYSTVWLVKSRAEESQGGGGVNEGG